MNGFKFAVSIVSALLISSAAHAATVRFDDSVTPRSMDDLVDRVRALYEAGESSITVQLESGGGDLAAAFDAYRQLQRYDVNTLVRGECASACTVLFAAGNSRMATSGAQFMFHAIHIESIRYRPGLGDENRRRARSEVSDRFSGEWLSIIRSVDPDLANELERQDVLTRGGERWFSGSRLSQTGYVNTLL